MLLRFISFSFIIIFPLQVLGKVPRKFLSGELGLNTNISKLFDQDVNKAMGYGISAYYLVKDNKKSDFFLGLEFNTIRYNRNYVYESRFAHLEDVHYSFNTFSVPLIYRVNLDAESMIFTELGLRYEFNIGGNMKGDYLSYLPDTNNQVLYSNMPFKEKVTWQSEGRSLFNLLPSVGLGIKKSLKRTYLIVALDYRFDLLSFYQSSKELAVSYINLSARMGMKRGKSKV